MSGLVGYGSSDEEEEDVGKVIDSDQRPKPAEEVLAQSQPYSTPQNQAREGVVQDRNTVAVHAPTAIPPSSNGPLSGPSLGPSFPPAVEIDPETPVRAQSPHTAYREVIQNMTLPTVPNFDIPPSPPGSPPPGVDAKIQQFLKLKKQGMHFNEKLASSSALKNPSLLSKLIANAGLSEEQQYANMLPKEHWNPAAFQDWMYKENLEQARRLADKQRQDAVVGKARSSIDFVHGKQN